MLEFQLARSNLEFFCVILNLFYLPFFCAYWLLNRKTSCTYQRIGLQFILRLITLSVFEVCFEHWHFNVFD